MSLIEWLQDGEPSIKRLVNKYLLEQSCEYTEEGWIKEYLEKFDKKKKTWGNGIYSPKWVSTFYTMRELTKLEIDPNNKIFQSGMNTLLKNMWNDKWKDDDICVVAMLLSMCIYAKVDQRFITEMVNFITKHQIADGGFNCSCTRAKVKASSINSTLSVLEAFADLKKSTYKYNVRTIDNMEHESKAYLLRKRLLRRQTNGEYIKTYIVDIHYPVRWHYDFLRALEYFANNANPYDFSMEEALNILKEKFKKGVLSKGSSFGSKTHFKISSEDGKRMNTYRGLRILKAYDPMLYEQLINE